MALLTPTIAWNPPALLLAGMVVDSALNAVAQITSGGSTSAVSGAMVYDPPAGTLAASVPVVPPYTAVAPSLTIAASFTPDDPETYAPATASVTITLATAYLIPADARLLMAGIPAARLNGLASQADVDLVALLLAASQDIDVAMRYQGRKLIETQEREFPRLAYGPPPITRQFAMGYPGFFGLVYPFSADTRIWDLDLTGATTGTVTAIVPTNVKLATIYQAAWILDPTHAQRMEMIHSGLTEQSTGGSRETYLRKGEAPFSRLGQIAEQLMEKYLLRSGRLL